MKSETQKQLCNCLEMSVYDGMAFMTGNGHNPQCEHYKKSEYNVYRLGCDWYMAKTIDEAKAKRLADYGNSPDAVEDHDETQDGEAYQLTFEQMSRLTFRDDDGTTRSFFEQYFKLNCEGAKTEMFASSEC